MSHDNPCLLLELRKFVRWPYGKVSCFVGRTLVLLLPLRFYCSGFKSIFLNSGTAYVFLGTERWSKATYTHCKYSWVCNPIFPFISVRIHFLSVWNLSGLGWSCFYVYTNKTSLFFLFKKIHIFVLHHLFQPSGFPSILLMMSTFWK